MAAYPQKPKDVATIQGGLGIEHAFLFQEGQSTRGGNKTRDLAHGISATLGGSGFSAPTWDSTPYGPGLNFSSSSMALILDRTISKPTGTPVSLFFLCYPTTDGTLWSDAAGGDPKIHISSSVLKYDDNGGVSASLSGTLTLNAWQILGITVEKTTVRGWVNGINTGSNTWADPRPLRGTQWIGRNFRGVIAGMWAASQAWDGGTINQLQEDFWFPIRRRSVVFLKASAAAASVAPNDTTHSHSAESPTITQTHVVSPADATHGHAAESPTITQAHAISPDDSLHAHTAESPAITQAHEISPADCIHSHAAESPTITQAGEITPDDASHDHTADSPTIAHIHAVNPDEATHSHTVESPTITQVHGISPADAFHVHTAESPNVLEAGDPTPVVFLKLSARRTFVRMNARRTFARLKPRNTSHV